MLSKEETLRKITENLKHPQYQAEKIQYASNINIKEKEIQSRLRKLRDIARHFYYDPDISFEEYNNLHGYIFVAQAKFMQDVEDDYPYIVPPGYTYYWGYEYLQNPELRTYFTWRTKIRKKEYPKIPSAYIILYACEIINLIGFSTEEEAYQELKTIIKKYQSQMEEESAYLKQMLLNILKDFVINYQREVTEEDLELISPEANRFRNDKQKIYQKDYHQILSYLNHLSSYKLSRSKFLTSPFAYLLEKVVPPVLEALEEDMTKEHINFHSLILGTKVTMPYHLFYALPYVETRRKIKGKTFFSPIETYEFTANNWVTSYYYDNKDTHLFIGCLLKEVEAHLRIRTKFKYKLNINLHQIQNAKLSPAVKRYILNGPFFTIIDDTIDQVLKEESERIKQQVREKRKTQIAIDANLFDEIRQSAARMQEKLVVEEEREEQLSLWEEKETSLKVELIPEQESVVEMGFTGLLKTFTDLEKTLIQKILKKQSRLDLEQWAMENQTMLEVLMEAINLKALDYIGDNLLFENESIQVYPEYKEEMAKEMEEK